MNANLYSGLLIVAAGVLATATSSLTHSLSQALPALQILCLKSLIGLGIVAAVNIRTLAKLTYTQNAVWHAAKGLTGACGNVFWILALQKLTLADCSAVSLSSAVLTTVGAAYFFNERATKPLVMALLCGVMGAAIIAHPSRQLLGVAAFFPFISAVCFSASSLLTKRITVKDSFATTLFYLLLVMAGVSVGPALKQWVPPLPQDVFKLMGIGSLYVATQWALVKAYARGHAGFIAPFKFARFPLAIGAGWLFFGEVPPLSTLGGATLIGLGYGVLMRARGLKAYAG
jgi:drug/metabolite transporter (DMT)-like permease